MRSIRYVYAVGSWKGWSPVTPFTGLAAKQQERRVRTSYKPMKYPPSYPAGPPPVNGHGCSLCQRVPIKLHSLFIRTEPERKVPLKKCSGLLTRCGTLR